MPSLFSRLKSKDGATKKKKGANLDSADQLPAKPRWDDAYTRKTVEPEEIQDLIRRCTEEIKARGMSPHILLLLHASPFLANATRDAHKWLTCASARVQLSTTPSCFCHSVLRRILVLSVPSSATSLMAANLCVASSCRKSCA